MGKSRQKKKSPSKGKRCPNALLTPPPPKEEVALALANKHLSNEEILHIAIASNAGSPSIGGNTIRGKNLAGAFDAEASTTNPISPVKRDTEATMDETSPIADITGETSPTACPRFPHDHRTLTANANGSDRQSKETTISNKRTATWTEHHLGRDTTAGREEDSPPMVDANRSVTHKSGTTSGIAGMTTRPAQQPGMEATEGREEEALPAADANGSIVQGSGTTSGNTGTATWTSQHPEAETTAGKEEDGLPTVDAIGSTVQKLE